MTRVKASPRPSIYGLPVILLTAVLALAGCTLSYTGVQLGAAPATASANTWATACNLLTADEVAELAGQQLPEPREVKTDGLPSCYWGQSEGVEALSVPADLWVRQLPAMLDSEEQGGMPDDPEYRRQLEEHRKLLESGEYKGPDQACDFFATLLEVVHGVEPGTDRSISARPNEDDVQIINGQICTKGVFTMVELFKDGLSGSDGEGKRVATALLNAHRRGTAQ